MLYLLVVLFAAWNGYTIRWEQDKFNTRAKDGRVWHRIGVAIRVGVLLAAMFLFMPDWYSYVLNPAALLDGWHGGVLTVLSLFGTSYWIYVFTINMINKWDWDYNGFTERAHYRVTLYVWAVLTAAWLFGGGYFVSWIERTT